MIAAHAGLHGLPAGLPQRLPDTARTSPLTTPAALLLPACSTQVGRKASGPFKASLDKDYLKTGLRKP